MPHTTTWDSTGIKWQFHGAVTSEEVDEANREMYEDPRFDSIKYFIWDMSKVEKLISNELDVNKPAVTDYGASHSNEFIIGALVANEGHVYDSCENYLKISNKLNTKWNLKLFNDNESALKWLHTVK